MKLGAEDARNKKHGERKGVQRKAKGEEGLRNSQPVCPSGYILPPGWSLRHLSQ